MAFHEINHEIVIHQALQIQILVQSIKNESNFTGKTGRIIQNSFY